MHCARLKDISVGDYQRILVALKIHNITTTSEVRRVHFRAFLEPFDVGGIVLVVQ